MGRGTRRLLRLAVPSPVKTVERQLDPRARLVLGANPDGSLAALLDDCADAATACLAPAPAWTRAEFAALRDRVAARPGADDARLVRPGREGARRRPRGRLVACPPTPPPAQADAIADIRAQLDRLLPVRVSSRATGAAGLADLTRYLTAVGRRLERLPRLGRRATASGWTGCTPCRTRYDELSAPCRPPGGCRDIRDIARQIEETAGQPVGPAARHRPPGQRAAIHRAIDRLLAPRRNGTRSRWRFLGPTVGRGVHSGSRPAGCSRRAGSGGPSRLSTRVGLGEAGEAKGSGD